MNHHARPGIRPLATGRLALWPGRPVSLSAAARYAVAVGLAVGAILVRLALDALWGTKLPYITLYPAIMASAWLGGFGPGLVTTALTAIATEYFWIEPAGTWAVLDKTELIALLVFVGIGLFISALNEAWRRAIDAVAASNDRLAVTIQSIGDAVVSTDDQGRIVEMNPVAEALTGWSQGDAVGRPFSTVLVLIDEQSRRPAANPIERVLREGIIAGLANHTVLLARDLREVPIDDSAAPVRSVDGRVIGAVMVFRDITERRRIERERMESERAARELAAIVESSDDAISAMRLDGTMTAWNRAAERMYGYTSSEAIGRSIQLVVPDDRWAEELAYLDRVQVGEGVEHVETVRRRKDGSELPVSLTMSPVRNASGVIVGASKIARDITGRKQIEAERAALLTREHAARLELERASRLKDEFLAILSHELRTPLNAVLGYAHLLGSDALPPDRRRHAIEAIRRNAQAQARLVESLLDLSRILAGKLELDRRPHNLADIINAALDVIRPDGDAKGVSIETLEPLSPVVVTADATRLQQVFWNLLSNGVKFTPRGGRVTVESTLRGDSVMIEVRDTGQGIPAESLPQIFDRFKQAVGGNQARAGLGLGLAVVREMVQAHGGTIVAESAGEGRGSTFRLTLPAAVAMPDDYAAPSELAADDGSLGDLDILIVDDDGDARDLLALIVESRGACTRVADSTAAALELIREQWPNVLLADVRMPNEDGYALIGHVRAQENGRGRLPAIAVTANATADDRGRATAAGYDLHLTKPVDAADLTQAIARLTRAHRV